MTADDANLSHDEQDRSVPAAPIKDKLQARRDRARKSRQARKAAMESVGMKRVRGTMGGIYWE